MRSPAKSFQELVELRKAHQFVLSVYDLTGKFPGTEVYGLILSSIQRDSYFSGLACRIIISF